MNKEDWKYLLHLENELSNRLNSINFRAPPSKISYIYNPIDYAIQLHSSFVSQYFTYPKDVLFVGMNPGPFGMAQTGVPFGDVVTVRDWLKLKGQVEKLPQTHPSKPIIGLECGRVEVSGARFWGLFWKTLKLSPNEFFANCFVLNVCPFLFLDANGKNISLANIIAPIRHQIETSCNSFLIEVLKLIKPKLVVGVGRYATSRVENVLLFMKTPIGAYKNQKFKNLKRRSTAEPSKTSPPLHVIPNHTDKSTDIIHRNDISLMTYPQPSPHSHLNTSPLSERKMITEPIIFQSSSDSEDNRVDYNNSFAFPKLFTLMHPSPANPKANKGWEAIALKQLKESGILNYFDMK